MSVTAKPNIQSLLSLSGDKAVQDLIQQINRYLGLAVAIQGEGNGFVYLRYYKGALQVYEGTTWKTIAGNVTEGQVEILSQIVSDSTAFSKSVRFDSNIGFFGTPPAAKTAVADPAAMNSLDGEIEAIMPGNPLAAVQVVTGDIAGLTFSNPPTQAECEALRGKCELLAQDVEDINAAAGLSSDIGTLILKTEELGDDVRALLATVSSLVTALKGYGLI